VYRKTASWRMAVPVVGPGLRLDLWWKLDFGRPVDLDKIRLWCVRIFRMTAMEERGGGVLGWELVRSRLQILMISGVQFSEATGLVFRIHDLFRRIRRVCAFIELRLGARSTMMLTTFRDARLHGETNAFW